MADTKEVDPILDDDNINAWERQERLNAEKRAQDALGAPIERPASGNAAAPSDAGEYVGNDWGANYIPAGVGTRSSADSLARSYINTIYDSRKDAALSALRDAYEKNIFELELAKSKLPQGYDASRGAASASGEIGKNAFNEHAAARGLGSGAGAQAKLSIDAVTLGTLGKLSAEESSKLAELEMKRFDLAREYNNKSAQEASKWDADKADALYKDLVRTLK